MLKSNTGQRSPRLGPKDCVKMQKKNSITISSLLAWNGRPLILRIALEDGLMKFFASGQICINKKSFQWMVVDDDDLK